MVASRRIALTALLALAGAWGLGALPFFAWLASPQSISAGTSGILIVNRDPEASVETSAIHLTPGLSLGAVYPIPNSKLLTFAPNVLVYRSWYYWTSAGKAVPTGPEDREVWLMAALLDFPIALTLPLNPALDLSGALGLSLNLRLGIKADSSVDDSTVASINGYLWSQARFLSPTTALGLRIRIKEGLSGLIGLKAWWPISNLWAGEGLGFLDQTTATLNLSVSWIPGRKPAK